MKYVYQEISGWKRGEYNQVSHHFAVYKNICYLRYLWLKLNRHYCLKVLKTKNKNKEKMENFNSKEACEVQKRYQDENKEPKFAPSDGRCFRCGKNIYNEIDHGSYKTGISVEKASTQLITGCPHCHYSYCN